MREWVAFSGSFVGGVVRDRQMGIKVRNKGYSRGWEEGRNRARRCIG